MYLLAIDQGTSQTKALILDAAGQLLASHTAPLHTDIVADGRIEQDPMAVLESVRAACAPLLERFPATVAGLDNQGETFLRWEAASGRPVTPAISWQDQRGAAICAELRAADHADLIRERTGLLLDSYFSAPKLAHLLRQDPLLRRRAGAGELRFGTLDTWMIWNFGQGHPHITDPSTAARTLLYDIQRHIWDPDLLAQFDIPTSLLPQVLPSAGHAATLNLHGQTLELHAMLCDQPAALFGQRCLMAGQAKCSFGTGTFMLMNTGVRPAPSNHGLLSTIAWQIDGHATYALDGGIFTAGAAVEWLRDGLGLIASSAESAELAEQADPLATPICIPALAGLAAPCWRTDARASIFGLSRGSGQAELVRATLEGLAMRVGDVLLAMQADAGLPMQELRVDGGPARNRFLMQTIADDLGIVESTAMGIGNLARVSVGTIDLSQLAVDWQPSIRYTPRVSADERATRRARWERAMTTALAFHQG